MHWSRAFPNGPYLVLRGENSCAHFPAFVWLVPCLVKNPSTQTLPLHGADLALCSQQTSSTIYVLYSTRTPPNNPLPQGQHNPPHPIKIWPCIPSFSWATGTTIKLAIPHKEWALWPPTTLTPYSLTHPKPQHTSTCGMWKHIHHQSPTSTLTHRYHCHHVQTNGSANMPRISSPISFICTHSCPLTN